MTVHPQIRNVHLPGSRSEHWLSRYPRDHFGFSRASVESRLISFLQTHPNQLLSPSELMDSCRIYSKGRLQEAITAIREVIEDDPKQPVYLIRVGKTDGYILHDPSPLSSF